MIAVPRAPAVIALSAVDRLRETLAAGQDPAPELLALLGDYFLGEPSARTAFDAVLRSLGRAEPRGDAFLIQGVYGAGKSHLLAVLALLSGHPQQACPAFIASHPEWQAAAATFDRPRLVVAVSLDEYPAPTHPLEHILLSRIEREVARTCGVRLALTEQSHLLELVEQYVFPRAGDRLDEASRQVASMDWRELRDEDPEKAAQVSLAVVEQTGFPLDWRRSRAEAWGALRAAMEARGIPGLVLLLDELGVFLAGRDRRGLNADASFLQYLAQRTAGEPCWLICVTQRGLEEVGDIDRRTLRQLRDRFRPGLTLDLSELEWVVEHRLARKRDPHSFREAMAKLHACYCEHHPQIGFAPDELARCYPINPICLRIIQRAAEARLSQTRSVVRLLQEALAEQGWLGQPAHRLITPDVAFDVFRAEVALTPLGGRLLHAHDVVIAQAGRIAPGRERQLSIAMKTMCLLGLAEFTWPAEEIRSSLVGCQEAELWQSPHLLEELLRAVHQRGAYLERVRRPGEEAEEYYLEVASDVSERIRQRLNELAAELTPEDSRVGAAALAACSDPSFPLAGLAEPRSLTVEWSHARRYVTAACRDLSGLEAAELQNLVGTLSASATKEDAYLFLALPTSDRRAQEECWRTSAGAASGRFASGLLAWLPRELSERQLDHLLEHAALARTVADPTLGGRRDRELRDKVRGRWEDSEAEIRRMLQRAYYEGSIVGADGREAVPTPRLSALLGSWDDTLSAAFDAAFRALFPRFPSIAPERRLAGRAQTNQIIDQFIRPGEVSLPPASTLESHLAAYAAPLGLVEGEDRRYRLALSNSALSQDALAAAPARAGAEEISPEEVIPYPELAGRLAKSEWGLAREQSELLVAALLRTGHLVALDAFLQPTRLDAIAAPLGESLPYVMRAAALTGTPAQAAASLWAAIASQRCSHWDLPTQERAWRDLTAWAARLRAAAHETRAALALSAQTFGHPHEAWAWAEQALSHAEAVARGVNPSLTSNRGLAELARAVGRLPGGLEETVKALQSWLACERFIARESGELSSLYALLTDERVRLPEGALLARDHGRLLRDFSSPERLVSAAAEVKRAALRWLEAYRRHYLGWHSRAHADERFGRLLALKGSAALEAAAGFARAGLRTEAAAAIEAELRRALGLRCLAADPLPEGSVVCPACGIELGREIALPDPEAVERDTAETLAAQQRDLRGQAELIGRRLAGCRDEQVRASVEGLLTCRQGTAGDDIKPLLTDKAIVWLRSQLNQPRAQRRELRALEEKLRGKEVAKGEVRKIVEEWLGGGEEEVVEIV